MVVSQEGGLWSVVRFKAAYKLYRRAVEGVDVLVAIADREQDERAVLILRESDWLGPR